MLFNLFKKKEKKKEKREKKRIDDLEFKNKVLNEVLWKIKLWKIYLITWDPEVWKTIFIHSIADNIEDQWYDVERYYILEDAREMKKYLFLMKSNNVKKRLWEKVFRFWKYMNNGYIWTEDYRYYTFKIYEHCLDLIFDALDRSRFLIMKKFWKYIIKTLKNWIKFYIIDDWNKIKKKKTEKLISFIKKVINNFKVTFFIIWERENKILEENADYVIDITKKDWKTLFLIKKIDWKKTDIVLEWKYDPNEYEFTDFILLKK